MQYVKPERYCAQDPDIQKAANLLKRGGIVAFPTETVYGLAACFDQVAAVLRIYSAKGRPADNPLIAHISSLDQLSRLVSEWPEVANRLAEAFWPGPLTIVVPKQLDVPDIVTGGLGTVGVRMPGHPLALALIEATDTPLVAPSANRSGKPSPTIASHVLTDLTGRIDAVLDGGPTQVGLESTVVGVVGGQIEIYRPGSITREMLLGKGFDVREQSTSVPEAAPLSPGMKYAHYSPEAKICLVVGQALARVTEIARSYTTQGENVGVLVFDDTRQSLPELPWLHSLGSREDLGHAGRNLYALLRKADEDKLTVLIVEGVEPSGLGEALMNRLQKAASVIVEV